MAGIDKIYGTLEMYDALWAWADLCCPQIIKHFYSRDGFICAAGDLRPITNFPEEIDMWLINNCPLKWVVKAIKEQYLL